MGQSSQVIGFNLSTNQVMTLLDNGDFEGLSVHIRKRGKKDIKNGLVLTMETITGRVYNHELKDLESARKIIDRLLEKMVLL